MAHTKAGGKTRQQQPRPGKRLGIKVAVGKKIKIGQILVRQRGTKFHPGKNVGLGKDHTLYALAEGLLEFRRKFGKVFMTIKPS